jgi:predicted phage terminase large subunit-like protein
VDPRTHSTRGSTFDNAVNLAKSFIQDIRAKYEGTRIGRQELYAEVLEDVEGALWTLAMIDNGRVIDVPRFEAEGDDPWPGKPKLKRIVVAIDPSATHGENSDYTAISVAGLGFDGDIYILAAEAVKLSPHGWASRALDMAEHWGAGSIVYERNTGGEMVRETIANAIKERQRSGKMGLSPKLKPVVATKGKLTRAEPVAALYEQGRVHHVSPTGKANPLIALEDQMIVFPVAAEHDDLVDALVWGVHELMPATAQGHLRVL